VRKGHALFYNCSVCRFRSHYVSICADAQAWPLELVFMPRSYQKSSIGDRVSLHLTDIDPSADVGSAIIEDRFDIK
jgi:hypothetical protein